MHRRAALLAVALTLGAPSVVPAQAATPALPSFPSYQMTGCGFGALTPTTRGENVCVDGTATLSQMQVPGSGSRLTARLDVQLTPAPELRGTTFRDNGGYVAFGYTAPECDAGALCLPILENTRLVGSVGSVFTYEAVLFLPFERYTDAALLGGVLSYSYPDPNPAAGSAGANIYLQLSAVPEPSTLALTAGAALALALLRRRQRA